MRILIVNPNISVSVSKLIQQEAERTASADTTLGVVTAPFGVAYIETRAEAAVGAYAVLNLLAEHHQGHDAAIVAAFGDPGIAAAREILDIPVVGITEAALMSACMLGHRFSIIAISRRITAWYRETVEANGLITRLASIRALDRPLRDIGRVQEDHACYLKELCIRAVDEDGADVVILAGAPLAGLARQVRGEIPVPVVDGISSAVRHAESLVALNPGAARRGSFAPLPEKEVQGLPAPLQALIGRKPVS